MGQPALWIVDEHGEVIPNAAAALEANRENIRQAAQRYHEQDGFSLLMIRPVFRELGQEHIPAPREKSPYHVWNNLQYRPQRRETLTALLEKFPNGQLAALCGLASENLYGLDCDSPEMFDYICNRNPFATRIIAGRRGGTIFFRAPFPVKTRKGVSLAGVDGRLDILGQGSYQLLPPSFHPAGIHYQTKSAAAVLELDKADLAAFDFLQIEPADIGWEKPAAIPQRAWMILRGWYNASEFESRRSSAEHGAVLQLLGSGLSLDEIIRIFEQYANPNSKFKEIQRRDGTTAAREYIARSYRRGDCWITRQAVEFPATMNALKAWSESTDWRGPGGATLKLIFRQLIAYAEASHNFVFSFAQRRLALDVGIERQTVKNRIKDLMNLKLIERRRNNIGKKAARYRFHPDLVGRLKLNDWGKGEGTANSTPVREQVLLAVQGTLPGQDAFRAGQAGGLGKPAALVWQCLQESPAGLTPKDIQARTGRDIKTIRRALKRFIELEMVQDAGHKENSKERIFRAIPDVDLNLVAERLGSAGRAVAQMELFEAERQRYQKAATIKRNILMLRKKTLESASGTP